MDFLIIKKDCKRVQTTCWTPLVPLIISHIRCKSVSIRSFPHNSSLWVSIKAVSNNQGFKAAHGNNERQSWSFYLSYCIWITNNLLMVTHKHTPTHTYSLTYLSTLFPKWNKWNFNPQFVPYVSHWPWITHLKVATEQSNSNLCPSSFSNISI